MKTVLTVVVAGVLVFGVVVGAGYVFQRSLIYLPTGGPLPAASAELPGGQDVTLRTGDGLALQAWFFPAEGRNEHRAEDPAVLVAPGNGGNRAMRIPLAAELTERGMSVLLLDYRGYGDNEGSPTEEGLAKDVRAARSFLIEEAGVDPQRLLYYGESLGCGVVSELATEHPPAGMLLRSPFTELADTAAHHYPFLPVRTLLKERYPVAENVRALDGVPVRVVYGDADSIVPPEQSRAVAEAAGSEPLVVPGADHNDQALLDGPRLVASVEELAEGTAAP
ncbi:alpha/beta hydrolase [Haloechinothrix sp. LS1_15]|uniref:alpha/beta hydrolase n=1 Tax=Haloechinothrix sp. LS1_15 TaxID=2652248 RepID=UPI0029480776|nr:alpha/beta hydrolase [Haloechinothrix sp. LS1_15]MDV6012345.1 alpha/beta hydrolase [Haloechinothrix sp. LS1_15]